MPQFKAISEFVDIDTGERVKPGTFVDVSGPRMERLKEAGVIEIMKVDAEDPAVTENAEVTRSDAFEDFIDADTVIGGESDGAKTDNPAGNGTGKFGKGKKAFKAKSRGK